MKKKIFLTGGTGFIGRNIIELLSERYAIFAPSHKELDLTKQRDVDSCFKEQLFDVVLHCAIKPGHRNAKELSGLLECNTRMFYNILKNRGKFGRLIYLGSGLVYGLNNYIPKMKESYCGTVIPEDESGFSKYIIAKQIETDKDMVELRPFGVFGKYEDYSIRFISNVICKCIMNIPITLKQNKRFDYVCIEDFIDIVEKMIEVGWKRSAYNITPDSTFELLEIARLVMNITGKKLPIKIELNGFGREYSGDNSLLKSDFGFLKFTSLETSIRNLYTWYLERIESIDRESLLVDK